MNDTTFQGDGKVAYVPIVVNAKQQEPQTNADRIRAMTDEELAEFISGILFASTSFYAEIRKKLIRCKFKEWLDEEVKE